jgi:hydroxymethylglutaryl-CoA reductase
MMLAVPPVAAAVRALTVAAAAGGLVAAETHPAVTRTPANAAMASTEAARFLSMTSPFSS